MDIIIDAYNVLRLELTDDFITESQRKHFISLLRAYAQRKKHTMVVVFDGGEYRWAVQETHKEIVIIYSGTHQTADEAIITYIKRNLGRAMVLVSSDRQLRDEAAYYGLELVQSQDFLERLHAVIDNKAELTAHKAQAVKTSQEVQHELDVIMQRVMRMQIKPDDVEYDSRDRSSHGQHLSRKERKRIQRLKKL